MGVVTRMMECGALGTGVGRDTRLAMSWLGSGGRFCCWGAAPIVAPWGLGTDRDG